MPTWYSVLYEGGLIKSSYLSGKEGGITAPSTDEKAEAHSTEVISLDSQG